MENEIPHPEEMITQCPLRCKVGCHINMPYTQLAMGKDYRSTQLGDWAAGEILLIQKASDLVPSRPSY